MSELISRIFSDFIVDNVRIPVEFLRYKGKSEIYITWQSIGNNPTLVGDDEVIASIYDIDIDIYTKGNYLNIMKAVKQLMKENGFIWTMDSPDMYEDDTGYYHKTISFEKENIVN